MFRRLRDSFLRAHTPLLVGLAFCLCAASAAADAPPDAGQRAALIGQPASLSIQPETVTLVGPRAYQQVVVTGRYADGSVRDLTPFCDYACETADLADAAEGCVTPKKDGVGALVVKAGGQTARATLTVKDFGKPAPVSFRREVVAAMNVGGCNAGACHGTPSGKNGFKLSLRGFDPEADYLQLTRDVLGRRTDRGDPDASLMLLKALGHVPHEGGVRFAASSVPARAVRGWLAEGLQDDPAGLSPLQSIQILPGQRVLTDPSRWQQLSVTATFADGTVRDVTRLTVFSSSDTSVADGRRQRPGGVQGGRRGRRPVPLPDAIADGSPDVPRAAARLRLDQPAGKQLRRSARLRQAEDAEHPAVGRVHRCGVRPPGDAGRVRRAADAGRGARLPGRRLPRQARQAGGPPAGTAGICRLLDAEMVGCVPQQPQGDPGQGHARLPGLAAPARRKRRRLRRDRQARC